MADQIFTDAVQIDGSEDEVQLRVQGHTSQNESLQQWQDSANVVLAQLAADGRFQNGDISGGVSGALIEANKQTSLPSTDVKQGIQSRGEIRGQILDSLAWIVQELELLGSGGVESVQAAIRARIEHSNSGNSTNAELRAGDFEASNQSGSGAQRVGKITGVAGAASNQENAFTQDAVGIEGTVNNAIGGDVAEASVLRAKSPTNAGTITKLTGLEIEDIDAGIENFAIRTGKGVNQFGDSLELAELSVSPSFPSSGFTQVYAKSGDGLYTQNSTGNEYGLVSTGLFPMHVCQGRLTLVSGAPIVDSASDKDTLYFMPFNGNIVRIFNGTNWEIKTFSQLSISLAGLAQETNYDIFLKDINNNLTLISDVWDTNTARTADLEWQDGVRVKYGDPEALYLGTIRTTTLGKSADTPTQRFCWNYYNRRPRYGTVVHWGSHTYTGGWRDYNADGSLKVETIVGLWGDVVHIFVNGILKGDTNTTSGVIGVFNDAGGNLVTNASNANPKQVEIGQSNHISFKGYKAFHLKQRSDGGSTTFDHARIQVAYPY